MSSVMRLLAYFQPTKEWVGLLRKETGIRAQAEIVSALSLAGFKILAHTVGPAATITFKGSGKIPDEIRAMFEVVGPNQKFRVFPVETKDVHISIEDTMPWIGFDKVWKEADFKGAPTAIGGIIDTGLDELYEDYYFKGRIIERFTATGISGPINYHGRVVLAVAGRTPDSEGKYRGACYAAKFFVARGLGTYGDGTTGTVAQCWNWLLTKNVWAINLSLGGPHDDVLDAIAQRSWEQGTLAVCASGNNGIYPPPCCARMNCPADAPYAVAVGATDGGKAPKPPPPEPPPEPPEREAEWRETVMDWTARNPDALGRYQKNYCVNCGYAVCVGAGEPSASGTSLSSPHTWAVLLAVMYRLTLYNPDITPQERLRKALAIVFGTCLNLGYKGSPNYTDEEAFCIQGHGRPQAHDAYLKAKEAPTPSKIDKVEFYVDNVVIGEDTTAENDTFSFSKVIPEGEHLWKAKAYSEGLETVETETRRFTVKKEMPTEKIVATAKEPVDGAEFKEGTTITFKVEAKVVQA